MLTILSLFFWALLALAIAIICHIIGKYLARVLILWEIRRMFRKARKAMPEGEAKAYIKSAERQIVEAIKNEKI